MNLTFKIVIGGSSASGKSSLMERFLHNSFNYDHPVTFVANYEYGKFEKGKNSIKLLIWDFGGADHLRSSLPFLITGARGGLIVFDLEFDNSYQTVIGEWIKIFQKQGDINIPIIFIGNKVDRVDKKYNSVQRNNITQYAKKMGSVYIETSAKTGYNVDECFHKLIDKILIQQDEMQLIQQNYPVLLNYIQETSKHYPEKFLYMFDAGILDYLHPIDKSQLIQQNYNLIFKNLHKILKPEIAEGFEFYYPQTLLDIFEERLFDHLSPEKKKELIQQNFPVLDIYIQRLSRKRFNIHKISEETLSYMYLTVINAINGTKLIDDFFKALAEDFSFSDGVINAIDKAIHSIKENQELKLIFTAFRNTLRIKREEIKWNQELELLIFCNKCRIPLTPKSMDTLIMKGRVYCTYCGILNQRKYSFEAQSAYLEAKKKTNL